MSDWKKYIEQNTAIASSPRIDKHLSTLISRLAQISRAKTALIFTAGNGGSATTADHFAADLALTNKRVGHKIPAICLNSHLGLNSALSNDMSYELALSEQLKNFAFGEHLLIIFSASGNSRNLINLINTATDLGIECWAFLGFNGGEIVKMTEVNILVFSDNLFNYGIVENVHLAACHFIIEQVNLILGRDL